MSGGPDPELILRLCEAGYDKARGRLGALRAREAELKAAVDALEPRGTSPEGGIDPARRAGADLKWQGWADARRRVLFAEMARLRVEIAAAIEDLRPAFGRREAARRMVERAGAVRKVMARRRAERG